ncbi:MAG: DUF998 domain-containing protein [Rhizobiales bacterium]|nr:DUF998 domain-containing protein [Hyphomicrobiales bacterium]
MPFYQTAAGVSAGCYALALVLLIALHIVEPQRSPVSTAVSDYGTGKAAWLFKAYGAAGIIGAAALCRAMLDYPGAEFRKAAVYCLGALAVLRLGVLVFKADEGSFGRTREGLIHLAFAILTFTLAYEVVSIGGPTVLAITAGPLNAALAALGWIVPVSLALVVATMIPRLRAFFGLAERAFLVSTLLWFLLTAALLFAGA